VKTLMIPSARLGLQFVNRVSIWNAAIYPT